MALCLPLYGLGWSRLFPALRADTVTLLVVTGLLFIGLATWEGRREIQATAAPLKRSALAVITVYFVAACVENGGIPIVQILSGENYDVYSFGIPRFHIFMLAFTGYYGVRCFRTFLATHSWSALLWFLAIFGGLIAIANRSAASFLAFACLVVFLRTTRLGLRKAVALVVLGAVLVFVFGSFGNLRLTHQLEEVGSASTGAAALAEVASVSDSYVRTGVDPVYLWSYLYVTSPIANLNQAFAYSGGEPCGRTCDLVGLSVHQLVPEMLGRRAANLFGIEKFDKGQFLISPSLTASTMYGSGVGYAGMVGGLLVALTIGLLGMGTLRLLRASPVVEEAAGLVAALLFFGFFENMLAYSPMSLQLLFPLATLLVKRPRLAVGTGGPIGSGADGR